MSHVRDRRWPVWLALLAAMACAACSNEVGSVQQDAASIDRAFVDDLMRVDAGKSGDVLTAEDVSFDASNVDAGDAGVDIPTPDMPDVPGVTIGGYFIPVDPHAVPPPGSECVGDGGVRAGDPSIVPPRPIRPQSVSRVTSQRPTFQWALPEGTTGARVEVCADRCCTRVLQTFDAVGSTARPMVTLPPGVVFWRMFGRRGEVVGSRASYTWEFGVRRRDAPNDTSWGTIRDFNGDGLDDLFMFRSPVGEERPTEFLLVPGSTGGLLAPVATGVAGDRLPSRAVVGDFNGDGKSDLAWDDRDRSLEHSWLVFVYGTADTPRDHRLPDFRLLGSCARTGQSAAVDWNGDGYSDLVASIAFGCMSSVPVEETALVVYAGSPSGLATVPQAAWQVDSLLPHPLVAVRTGVGDVDLDGYGDVVAASLFTGGGTTHIPDEVAVLFGSPRNLPRIEVIREPLPRGGEWGFTTPKSIGDVDGDGHTDLMILTSNTDYVYRHPTGLRAPTSTLIPPLPSPVFWASFGDLNGDGFSDVIAGADGAFEELRGDRPYNPGRVYVFPGSPAGVSSEAVIVATSRLETDEAFYDYFGSQALSPGDVNGDGFDDLVCMDSFEQSLCTRVGRLDYSSGRPDVCRSGITTIRTSISTYIF